MEGLIYFLFNKAMPGLLKVGYTQNSIDERLTQLNSTGVPLPFQVGACFYVNDVELIEKNIHSLLDKFRLSNNREFFQVSIEEALNISFELIRGNILLTSSDDKARDQVITQKKSYELDAIDIELLQCLAHKDRNHGLEIFRIKDAGFKESELKIENRLTALKENGLVEERKNRDVYLGNIWRISSKGVKYLFDKDHIALSDDKLRWSIH